ncbi:MAG: tetratricopeptide repeat protein [Verrucomicrobiales bacterium]
MRRLVWLACFIFTTCLGRAALNVTLKDGDSFVAESMVPQGTKFQVSVAGQKPRVIEAAAIERVDMSEPANYAEMTNSYLAGDTVKMLQAMGKLRAELEPYKSVPGARDWWLDVEFLRGHILLHQKRFKEVEASMKEIAADDRDPEAKRHAQAFLAHMTGINGDPRKAVEELRAHIVATTDPDTLADAWLFAGHHYGTLGDQQSALLAYLRVPVFYPGRAIALAGARLGAARSFVALEDPARARASLKELIAKVPNTAEAAEGKRLLAQVERDLGLAAPEEPSKEKK